MHTKQEKPPLKWLNLIVLGLPPLIALSIVPWYGFAYGYDLSLWLWFLVLITFCEMSITAGYHRLWSHKAYQAHPVLKVIYALGGACALQNDCLTWAADHRRHHQFVDDNDKDPYSAGRGFWYAHFGWMIRDYKSTREDLSNVRDLLKDPILRWQRKYYLPLTLLMNIGLPLLIGYLLGDIWGALLLLGVLRLVLSQQFTWLINSAAHKWGSRDYDPRQTARDNGFIALLTYGEGYHNYHHTFAWDYRNGCKWYHYDPTKWFIKTCSWLRLTWGLRACSAFRQERARLDAQYLQALKKWEHFSLPLKWREHLEKEYQLITNTLTHWAELRQQWYQTKSRQVSDGIHARLQDIDPAHVRERYQALKQQLQEQRRNWDSLIETFARQRPRLN